jgi:myxalamid-type polyketide synthase MxaE and MxaD
MARQELVEIDRRAKLYLKGRARAPIAMIGMSCRFAGASSLQSFWELLRSGSDALAGTPPQRCVDLHSRVDRYHEARGGKPSARGGFLPQIDRFDAGFFGISPREAKAIDPQQCLLLETAWEALEDAGLDLKPLAGSRTGVFVGMWTADYEDHLFRSTRDVDIYTTTGGGRYAASGRISFAFDFRGPSLTVDTACSSSLVAVHLACQSLRSGECGLALVGGANLILRPEINIGYAKAGVLSPDGRCKLRSVLPPRMAVSNGISISCRKSAG